MQKSNLFGSKEEPIVEYMKAVASTVLIKEVYDKTSFEVSESADEKEMYSIIETNTGFQLIANTHFMKVEIEKADPVNPVNAESRVKMELYDVLSKISTKNIVANKDLLDKLDKLIIKVESVFNAEHKIELFALMLIINLIEGSKEIDSLHEKALAGLSK